MRPWSRRSKRTCAELIALTEIDAELPQPHILKRRLDEARQSWGGVDCSRRGEDGDDAEPCAGAHVVRRERRHSPSGTPTSAWQNCDERPERKCRIVQQASCSGLEFRKDCA